MPSASTRSMIFGRVLLFSLASNLAVLFVLKFGDAFWPQGLPAAAHHIFWLASGVNLAGLLALGLRYWPVIILDAIPAWLYTGDRTGEALFINTLAATSNALEALLAAWIVLRLGAFAGRFDRLRTVGALLLASMVAPLINSIIIPAYFCARGRMPWEDFGKAIGNWNLANGAAMLLLAPLILAFLRRAWSFQPRAKEAAALVIVAGLISVVAFQAVFSGYGLNFTFAVFPVVLYAAVRFGSGEVAAVLGLLTVSIYLTLAGHAHTMPPDELSRAIWFVQAFCWVLAALGLLVAALSAERLQAEHRSLEATLSVERARLAALRYQINPHFLFNALNSVRASIPLEQKIPREMITDLAGYLRTTLDHDDTDRVPLREELRSVRDYLAIEQRRFGEHLQFTSEIAPATLEVEVPVFLLQPLVENAIRHGLESSPETCRITIHASIEAKRLHLEVANTGTWRDETQSRSGLGLANIRRRLTLLYQDQARFEITHGDGTVRIALEMPV